jgi:hypothetical protein
MTDYPEPPRTALLRFFRDDPLGPMLSRAVSLRS